MGKANLAVNQLLTRKPVFADLINGIFHGGKQILKAEELDVLSSHTGTFLLDKQGNTKAQERFGDIRMTANNRSYSVLFAEETQAGVHYAMPVRTMQYVSQEYLKQVQDIEKLHKDHGDKLQGDEFISGMSKTDRLKPVVHIVLYLGNNWDGSRSLYDLLDIDWDKPEAQELQGCIPDFPINLVCVKDIPHPENFNTCLQHIFSMLKCNRDKRQLYDYIKCHRSELEQMDSVEHIAAMVLLDMQKKVEELMEQHVDEKEISMCKAIEDLIKDGEAVGEARGKSLGEAQLASLVQALLKDGRMDALEQAMTDPSYRIKLYEEYQLN